MMSLATFKFLYWLVFIWGGLGMLFILVVAVKELFTIMKSKNNEEIVGKTEDQTVDSSKS
jgi:hypothetical protein